MTPTPDGRLAVQALAGTALPRTWPTRRPPEKLPLVPEGWAQARIRQQQDERWQRIEAEHAANHPAGTAANNTKNVV